MNTVTQSVITTDCLSQIRLFSNSNGLRTFFFLRIVGLRYECVPSNVMNFEYVNSWGLTRTTLICSALLYLGERWPQENEWVSCINWTIYKIHCVKHRIYIQTLWLKSPNLGTFIKIRGPGKSGPSPAGAKLRTVKNKKMKPRANKSSWHTA